MTSLAKMSYWVLHAGRRSVSNLVSLGGGALEESARHTADPQRP
jgi:hypothetical protein